MPRTQVTPTEPSVTATTTTPLEVSKPSGGTKTIRPKGALPLAIVGGLVAAGGTTLAIYGWRQIPSTCDLGANTCSAAPGDPVFDEASSATTKLNIGMIAGGIGAIALVGGLIWYTTGAREQGETLAVTPWIDGAGGGAQVGGRF